jgi:hypothetical protein
MASTDPIAEGFNAGYIIEKHQPELAQQLNAAVESVEDEFFQGFVAGSQQYAKERTQSKTISKLRDASRSIPRPTQDRSKDDKDKGFEIDR